MYSFSKHVCVVEFMIVEIGSHVLEVCYGSVMKFAMDLWRVIICDGSFVNLSFIIINHFSNFYPVLM